MTRNDGEIVWKHLQLKGKIRDDLIRGKKKEIIIETCIKYYSSYREAITSLDFVELLADRQTHLQFCLRIMKDVLEEHKLGGKGRKKLL